MTRIIDWFTRNSTAANLLVLLIVAGGFFQSCRVQQRLLPAFSPGVIQISVDYPGASPGEVERSVVVRIEERIEGLEGVARVTASAREGFGVVNAELRPGADETVVLNDVKALVDAIVAFPIEAERPVVSVLIPPERVMSVVLSGTADPRTLKLLGERVVEDLSALPEVSHVDLVGVRSDEIAIEVSEAALRRHGLTFDDIVAGVKRSSLDLPGGSLRSTSGDILVRTEGQARVGREFDELVLISRADGTRLRLADVAVVSDGFVETGELTRFDGQPAVIARVFRAGDERLFDVASAVDAYVARAAERLPEGVGLAVWRDDSRLIRGRLQALSRSAGAGLVLVVGVLSLFLGMRLALWVGVGIPVAFLGTLAMLPILGISLDMMSIFAFIVVLGLVVDDAIIVGDAIERRQRRDSDRARASSAGAAELAPPVVVAALTTMLACVPVLWIPGVIGGVIRPLPTIVIVALAISLVECLLILPAHLAHVGVRGTLPGWLLRLSRVPRATSAALERFVEQRYRPALRAALRSRAVTVSGFVAVLLLSAGLVVGGWIPTAFMPPVEDDYVTALLTFPVGTPEQTTERAVRELERSAEQLRRELGDSASKPGVPIIRHVLTHTGSQPKRASLDFLDPLSWIGASGAHLAQVAIELAPPEHRDRSTNEIAERWRSLTRSVDGAVELEFSVSAVATGDPLSIRLAGPDSAALELASEGLRTALQSYPGVREVSDSRRSGMPELRLRLREDAVALGLSVTDLARQVRQGLQGAVVQRIQRGRDDVPVVVRYPEAERRSIGDLEQTRIRTAAGAPVSFRAVAEAELVPGIASIERVDRWRTLTVSADVDRRVANASVILADLEASVFPALAASYPTVRFSVAGQGREQREAFAGAMQGLAAAALAIFVLLAAQLRSYSQPLVILVAIPFSGIGALLGHVLIGIEFSALAAVGLFALAGVMVNDALILLVAMNRNRERGLALDDAVVEAGVERFRPILLTSLTTFLAVLPLLIDPSRAAQYLKPIAVSLGFGILAATAVALLLVPALYALLSDLRALVQPSRSRVRAPAPVKTAEVLYTRP